jgi:HlyD family secretion protein
MSAHQLPNARRSRRATVVVAACIFLAITIGMICTAVRLRGPRKNIPTHQVHYETLQPTTLVRGDVESSEVTDIVCRVRAWSGPTSPATIIKSIVDNGAQVRRGELIVELDDSWFREQLKERKVLLEQARADWVYAEENMKIVDSQNQSDMDATRVAAQLGELDLLKYIKGEYPQACKDVQGRLTLARSGLEMWRDRLAWTERMVRKGFLSIGQSRAEQAHLQSGAVDFDRLCEEARVLEQYTQKRTVQDLQSKLGEARLEVQRASLQAQARSATAAADRAAKMRIYQNRLMRVHEFEHDIEQCKIRAPHDGIAIYAISDQARSGLRSTLIAPGEPVRQGQRLLYLPNLKKMEVITLVHEAVVTQVHPGQRATVHVDAYPDRVWKGHVRKVAVFPSSDWGIQDVRVFRTQVTIDDPTEDLKPDMTAQVTIFTGERMNHVLTVPLEALVHSPQQGNHCTGFAITPEGPEERDIVIGMHTDELAVVQSGLNDGEEVVLDPHALLNDKIKTGTSDDSSHSTIMVP